MNMPRLVELSHTIHPDIPLFSQAAPRPGLEPWMSHQQAAESGRYEGCTCELSQAKFITSIGTYLDSPYHFHPAKGSIETLPLEKLVLPGIRVDCPEAKPGQPINPDLLEGLDLKGKAVLFNTGWSRYWGEPRYHDFPFVSEDTALALIEKGASLAGVDCMVIDSLEDPRRPVHVNLLGAGVLIAENLTNLSALPREGFIFSAAPVKMKGAAAFPVRAHALIMD